MMAKYWWETESLESAILEAEAGESLGIPGVVEDTYSPIDLPMEAEFLGVPRTEDIGEAVPIPEDTRTFFEKIKDIGRGGIGGGYTGIGRLVGLGVKKYAQMSGDDTLEGWGDESIKYWGNKAQEWAVPEWDVNPVDQPSVLLSPGFWAYQMGKQAPIIASGIVGGPTAAGVTGGLLMGSDTYLEMKEKGVSEEAAARAGTIDLVLGTFLERVGASAWLRSVGGKLMKALKGGTGEFATEFSQEFSSNINKDINRLLDEDKSMPEIQAHIGSKLKDYLKESVGAGITGFGLGTIMGAMNPNQADKELSDELGVAPRKGSEEDVIRKIEQEERAINSLDFDEQTGEIVVRPVTEEAAPVTPAVEIVEEAQREIVEEPLEAVRPAVTPTEPTVPVIPEEAVTEAPRPLPVTPEELVAPEPQYKEPIGPTPGEPLAIRGPAVSPVQPVVEAPVEGRITEDLRKQMTQPEKDIYDDRTAPVGQKMPATTLINNINKADIREEVIEKAQNVSEDISSDTSLVTVMTKVGDKTFRTITEDVVEEKIAGPVEEEITEEGVIDAIKDENILDLYADKDTPIPEKMSMTEVVQKIQDGGIESQVMEKIQRVRELPEGTTLPKAVTLMGDTSIRNIVIEVIEETPQRISTDISTDIVTPDTPVTPMTTTITSDPLYQVYLPGKKITKKTKEERAAEATVEVQKSLEEVSKLADQKSTWISKATDTTKKTWDGFKKFNRNNIQVLSETLGNINEKYKMQMKNYEARVNTVTKDRLDRAKRWFDLYKGISAKNKAKYNFLLNNYNKKAHRNELDKMHQQDPELGAAFNETRSILKEIEKDAVAWGLIKRGRKFYQPNRVKDLDGLMDYIEKNKKVGGIKNVMAEIKATLPKDATEEDVRQAIRNMLKQGRYPTLYNIPGSAKKRTVWDIDENMVQFYESPVIALESHVRELTDNVEQRRVVGASRTGILEKKIEDFENIVIAGNTLSEAQQNSLDKAREDIKQIDADVLSSLSSKLEEDIVSGELTREQQQIIMDVWKARLNAKGVNKTFAALKDLGMASALGQFTSTVTQLGDFPHIAKRYGFQTALKAMAARKTYTKEDIDVHSYVKEVSENSKTSRLLDNVLKITGFEAVDSFFKATTMEAALINARKMKNLAEFRKEYKRYEGVEDLNRLFRDIKNNKKTDRVRRFALIELSETQPIALSELPRGFVEGGDRRMLYALKTYQIKALNTMIADSKRKAKKGIKIPGKKETIKGPAAFGINMAAYATLLTLSGATTDLIKDLITGDEPEIPETVLDNMLKLIFMSRYTAGNLAEGDIRGVIGNFVAPPTGWIDKPLQDIYGHVTGNSSEWRTITEIPVAGRIIYKRTSSEVARRNLGDKRKKLFSLLREDIEEGSNANRPEIRRLQRQYKKELMELQKTNPGNERLQKMKPITFESIKRASGRYRKEKIKKRREGSKGLLSSVAEAVSPREAVASELPQEEQRKIEEYGGGTPQFDTEFLEEVEGKENELYIPKKDGKVLGNSGATVASGFDLGQWDKKSLETIGLSSTIIEKLTPYLGKKKNNALIFLNKNPLTLNDEEVTEINSKVKPYMAKKVQEVFNKESDVKFEDLPTELQTAIISVYFQYGSLKTETPNFWKQVVSGDWDAAYKNLMDFGDKYGTRRKKEAQLLVDAGVVKKPDIATY